MELKADLTINGQHPLYYKYFTDFTSAWQYSILRPQCVCLYPYQEGDISKHKLLLMNGELLSPDNPLYHNGTRVSMVWNGKQYLDGNAYNLLLFVDTESNESTVHLHDVQNNTFSELCKTNDYSLLQVAYAADDNSPFNISRFGYAIQSLFNPYTNTYASTSRYSAAETYNLNFKGIKNVNGALVPDYTYEQKIKPGNRNEYMGFLKDIIVFDDYFYSFADKTFTPITWTHNNVTYNRNYILADGVLYNATNMQQTGYTYPADSILNPTDSPYIIAPNDGIYGIDSQTPLAQGVGNVVGVLGEADDLYYCDNYRIWKASVQQQTVTYVSDIYGLNENSEIALYVSPYNDLQDSSRNNIFVIHDIAANKAYIYFSLDDLINKVNYTYVDYIPTTYKIQFFSDNDYVCIGYQIISKNRNVVNMVSKSNDNYIKEYINFGDTIYNTMGRLYSKSKNTVNFFYPSYSTAAALLLVKSI